MSINRIQRRARRWMTTAAGLVLVTALAAGLADPASAAAVRATRQLRITSGAGLHAPDPSVMHVTKGPDAGWYVYFGGGQAIRGTKAPAVTGRYGAQPVLVGPQSWFSSAAGSPDGSHELWAPSVFPVNNHYVMYFAAWNPDEQARCLGIAVGPRPMGPFALASGVGPICAPPSANSGGTRASVIDPSFYQNSAGQRSMIFQAGVGNKVNVAIWSYRMQRNGVTPVGRPEILLRAPAPGVAASFENPQLIRHSGRRYLFVSSNYWRTCRYHTDVYVARPDGSFRRTQTPIALLTQANTGLCGPGGASLTPDGAVIVFTAWVPQRGADPPGVRLAYTANLSWGANGPR